MPEQIVIKEGAIFIADSHENENRKNFLRFLYALKSGEIKTPQLFLMGDCLIFWLASASFSSNFTSDTSARSTSWARKWKFIILREITILTWHLCLKTSKPIRSAPSRLNLPRSADRAYLSRMEIYFCLSLQNTL